MDRAWLDAAENLEFLDPVPFLRRLRELEPERIPMASKTRRANVFGEWRELREAAIFCYGWGQRMGHPVFLAKARSPGYDFAASWMTDDAHHIVPVQLKEVVPVDRNPAGSLHATLDSLPPEYVDSEELTVVIHLKQQLHFDPTRLPLPTLRIAALWVFGAIAPRDAQWVLWGNLLDQPERSQFAYPE